MNATTVTDLCRITVISPTSFADLAVPTTTPVAELVPALLRHCDDRTLADRPAVLQTLGGAPLEPTDTIESSGVRDGDSLYLRPREDPMPSMVFDDLIDGVGATVEARPDTWGPNATATLCTTVAVIALGFGLAAGWWFGPSSALVSTSIGAALALLGAAAVATRLMDAGRTGFVLALAGCCYATLGGATTALTAGGQASGSFLELPRGWNVDAAVLLAGSTMLGVSSVLAAIATGRHIDVFVGLATAAVGAIGVGLTITSTGWSWEDTAATAIVVAVLAGPMLPPLSYRIAGLRPQDLPTDVDDLGSDLVEPIPGTEVVQRAQLADRVLSGMLIGTSVVVVVGMVGVARASGTAPVVLLVSVGAALLLRSRLLNGGRQKVATALAGTAVVVALVARFAAAFDGTERLLAAMGLAIAGGLLMLLAASRLPTMRWSPYWGRSADLLESLFAILLLPVLFSMLGVYATARGIGG
ncbi:MAG: type VII secretion integral membrane protein EccD [Actinomycetota bacterium]